MVIRIRSYPRAGLIGNPSDGYYGKTISFLFKNFFAEVLLWESPELEILPNSRDQSTFKSVRHLVDDVRNYGYYGGIRLLKATIRKFHDYCEQQKIVLPKRNFTLRYRSNIPHRVGLAGSSAIVTACVKALKEFYGVEIPNPVQPNLVLSVEKDELQIGAGLQDRVIQTYGGMVYMDFNKDLMARQGHGHYESLDIALLPPIYIAYDARLLTEGSEVFHNNIRARYDRGERKVVEAMAYWAGLTDKVRDCLVRGDHRALPALLNANFDKRREIYQISARNLEMVEAARSVGASAKFSGSGGAIVGTYEGEKMFDRLQKKLDAMGVEVLKPVLQ